MMTKALVISRLTIYTSDGSACTDDWPYLRGLELADPDYLADDRIEVLFVRFAPGSVLFSATVYDVKVQPSLKARR